MGFIITVFYWFPTAAVVLGLIRLQEAFSYLESKKKTISQVPCIVVLHLYR